MQWRCICRRGSTTSLHLCLCPFVRPSVSGFPSALEMCKIYMARNKKLVNGNMTKNLLKCCFFPPLPANLKRIVKLVSKWTFSGNTEIKILEISLPHLSLSPPSLSPLFYLSPSLSPHLSLPFSFHFSLSFSPISLPLLSLLLLSPISL